MKTRRSSVIGTQLLSSGAGSCSALQRVREKKNISVHLLWHKHTSILHFQVPHLIKSNLGHPLVWGSFRHLKLRRGLFYDYFEVNTVAASHYLFSCQPCYDMNKKVVGFIPALCGATVRWASLFRRQCWLIILKAGGGNKLSLSDGVLLRPEALTWFFFFPHIGFSCFHLCLFPVPGWTRVERNESVGQGGECVNTGAVKIEGEQTCGIPGQLSNTHVKRMSVNTLQ